MQMKFTLAVMFAASPCLADAVPDYAKDVAPLMRKYCTACHNSEDKEGGLSLATYADINKGGKRGRAMWPKRPDSSLLLQVLNGGAKPAMPPEGSDAPTDEEIAVLAAWVKSGAKGPDGAEPAPRLVVPRIKPQGNVRNAVTALAVAPDGKTLAVGRFQQLELRDAESRKLIRTVEKLPGKVNSIKFSSDGKQIVIATGVTGLNGEARLIDAASGKTNKTFGGHGDVLFAAALSPNDELLATAGYDRAVIVWDVKTGKQLRKFTGHNDAVYDLAFSPDGSALASASGDETVKLWHIEQGIRLDTLSQPQAEQYAVTFSPNGRHVIAGGADNRIRVWRFVSRDKPRINPLLHARFAHEGAIVGLALSGDGKTLATASEDRVIKLWETRGYSQIHAWENQPDVAETLSFVDGKSQLLAGRLDGSLESLSLPRIVEQGGATRAVKPKLVAMSAAPKPTAEQEPNNAPKQAQPLKLPATVKGAIQQAADVDVYRFSAKQGEQWVMEINAARSKSPLDSKVEVLDTDGNSILRVKLQALRDSYFTFRGKDSDTTGDFRVHNWREMELNEYLYSNGEVVKLWLYPRGPDSGFNVYPGTGKRYTYFDTTPISHPLNAPCYIVRPYAPAAEIVPNGLPVFPVYFENDDESRRKLGSDSKLTFTAPRDGDYLVRVSDVRGFGSAKHTYELAVRPRQPDFKVSLQGANPKVVPGSGKEFTVRVDRMDSFDGPVEVNIEGMPPGFHVTSPLVIQAEQNVAFGVINADPKAAAPTKGNGGQTKVNATAVIAGKRVTKPVNNLGTIALEPKKQLLLRVVPAGKSQGEITADNPLELNIEPGQTIMARVQVDRNGVKGPISFGKEDSGRNLPHGVFIDNIGLNGLLIVPDKSERNFFITAAPWVPETTRTFHLKTGSGGNQASWPVVLHVRHPPRQASAK